MSEDEPDIEYDPNFVKQQLAWQFGCTDTRIQQGIVLKQGTKENGVPFYGELEMDFMPGRTLKSIWAELDETTKDRVCQDIWDLVATTQAAIPRPDDLAPGLYRTVDGSPSPDPLLGDDNDVAPREMDDDAFRERIRTRYIAFHGLSYRGGKDVGGLLPRSNGTSVFTHGDLAPRNIVFDSDYRITAVLDWESSGWFPDYWEYAQLMKWCDPAEHEWQKWMTKTRPRAWDITGIQKARRVLF